MQHYLISCLGCMIAIIIYQVLSNIWHKRAYRKAKMRFTYRKKWDVGYLNVQPTEGIDHVHLRTEQVAPGINFDYRQDTGELWGIEVFGINNIKDEENKYDYPDA
jgi:hypothetical protein